MSKAKATSGESKLHVRGQEVARVYAEALYNAAAKKGKMDAIRDQIGALVDDLFKADPLLEKFLASNAIRRDAKRHTLEHAFQGNADPMLVDFLQVLNNHGRLDMLRSIAAAFRDLDEERSRRMHVRVRSASPLSPEQQERLKAELRESHEKEPILDVQIEPDLLGGMIVQVGDWLFDGSVKSKLERLRNQLMVSSNYV